jgi:hypothetical protein
MDYIRGQVMLCTATTMHSSTGASMQVPLTVLKHECSTPPTATSMVRRAVHRQQSPRPICCIEDSAFLTRFTFLRRLLAQVCQTKTSIGFQGFTT